VRAQFYKSVPCLTFTQVLDAGVQVASHQVQYSVLDRYVSHSAKLSVLGLAI